MTLECHPDPSGARPRIQSDPRRLHNARKHHTCICGNMCQPYCIFQLSHLTWPIGWRGARSGYFCIWGGSTVDSFL
ncbi:unnamed protein product [Tenebrio molitor]|nr:unnamed protein product [Tenebrio molitor]